MLQKRFLAASLLPCALFLAACQGDVADDDDAASSVSFSEDASDAAMEGGDTMAPVAMIVSINPTASGGTMQIDRVELFEGEEEAAAAIREDDPDCATRLGNADCIPENAAYLRNAEQVIDTLPLSDEMEIQLTGTGGTVDGERVTAEELVSRFASDSALKAMPFRIDLDVDGRVQRIEQVEFAY